MSIRNALRLFFLLLLLPVMSAAQTHFTFTANTGSNATLAIPLSANPKIGSTPLVNGDEIGAFTPAGLCVGAVVWTGTGNVAISLWGDNTYTTAIDGIQQGEEIKFRIWKKSENKEYPAVPTYVSSSFLNTTGKYADNALYQLSSLEATASSPTKYLVTSSNYTPIAGTPVIIRAQLADATDAPVPTAGILVTWSKSGTGGSFSSPTSTTDVNGIATVTFTSGSTQGTVYVITATDNSGLTGTSAGITTIAGTVSGYKVTSSTYNPAAGTSVTVIAQLVDMNQNPVALSDRVITWTKSGTGGSLSSSTGITDASGAATVTLTTSTISGVSCTITAKDNSLLSGTSPPIITIAGPPARYLLNVSRNELFVGDTISVKAQLADLYSNPVLTGGRTVYWSQSGDQGIFQSVSTLANSNGEASNIFTTGTNSSGRFVIRVTDLQNISGVTDTVRTILESPQLLFPIDGASNIAPGVTFRWSKVKGAASYILELAPDIPLFGTMTKSTITDTMATMTALVTDKKYFWRVIAKDAFGISDYSQVNSFTTVTTMLAQPVLLSPSNRATGLGSSVTLLWSSLGPSVTYHLQVSASELFTAVITDQKIFQDTAFTLIGLARGVRYFWRISGISNSGEGLFSTASSFTTLIASPERPLPLQPADGTTGVSVTPTLFWNKSKGASNYLFDFSATSDFQTYLIRDSSLVDTSLQVGPLEKDRSYYWRLRAQNEGGMSTYSIVYSFRTIIAPPPAPALLLPLDRDTAVSLSPLFTWDPPSAAASYWLQVATDREFNTLAINDTNLTGGSRQVQNLSPLTNYYWRVRAKNAGGVSPFSTIRTFRTILSTPATPVLSFPTDKEQNVSTSPVFRWRSVAFASTYWIQLSLNEAFSTIVFESTSLSDTVVTVPSVLANTMYFWRVRAENAMGPSQFSSPYRFITGGISAVEALEGSIPKEFNLVQNYPNPFNPVTSIRYSIPKQCRVRLDVFNLVGQRVATLVDEEQQAGWYQVRFDGSKLISGVYFYRITADEYRSMQKLMLLR